MRIIEKISMQEYSRYLGPVPALCFILAVLWAMLGTYGMTQRPDIPFFPTLFSFFLTAAAISAAGGQIVVLSCKYAHALKILERQFNGK